MENLKQLDHIVDDWQRNVEPNNFALFVAHAMIRNAQEDPEWCAYLVNEHIAQGLTGHGLNVHDMLSFGLMVMERV